MEDTVFQFLRNPAVSNLIVAGVGIALIWIILRVVQRNLISKLKDTENRLRAKKLSKLTGYLLSLVLLLIVFSEKLGGFTVALGVAGAGVAFALQEVIASLAGWLAVMFGGFYKTGDRVQLGGIKGDVIDIGVLRTTIMEIGQWVDGDLYNGRIVRVANSFVFKEPVFNYSADFPFVWDEIKIPVMYGSDYLLARQIIEETAHKNVGIYAQNAREKWKAVVHKYLIEDASTDPMITLTANENWVEFTLRYTVDFKKRRITKDVLFYDIIREIDASAGKVRFASATLQLHLAPSFQLSTPKTN